MQQGSLVTDRMLPRTIRDICRRRNIDFRAFSDDWVLRLEQDGQVRWVVGSAFDISRAASAKLALDKVAAYLVVTSAGIPAVEHHLVRISPDDELAQEFDVSILPAGPVVIKPLDGMASRGVERYETADEALRAIRTKPEPAWAIAPYYDLAAEYRLLMLDGRVLLAFEKTRPSFRGKLKLFNLNQGAVAVDITGSALLHELTTIAERVMQATGLRLGAVDIVRTVDGRLLLMEINGSVTLEHYVQQSQERKNRAIAAYDAIVTAMFA